MPQRRPAMELEYLESRRMLTGASGVPMLPSIVAAVPGDSRVFVRDRLPSGALGDGRPLVIHGVDWSPDSIGTPVQDLQQEFGRWYATDIPLMAKMGVNVVRVYHDFGIGPQAIQILDEFYQYHIKVVVTVDSPEQGVNADLANITQVVSAYKNHPAILMWAIGNEWDLNVGGGFDYGTFSTLFDAATYVEQSAKLIKSLDANHPVSTFMADPNIPRVHPLSPDAFPFATGRPYTSDLVNTIARDVDVWGFNVYRGASFQDVFQMWHSISSKPMLVGEFGADSYDHRINAENQAMQAQFDVGLWDEVAYELSAERTDGVALGALAFEFRDEWWKNGSPSTHDISSERNFGQPDGYNDEEWFGLVGIDQSPKQAYTVLQGRFTGTTTPAVDAMPTLAAISQAADVGHSGAEFQIDGKTVYQRAGGASGGRGINVAVLDMHTGIRMLETRNFDTWFSPSGFGGPHTHFAELVNYLNGLPDGAIVLLALGDEGGFINPATAQPWANDPYVLQGYAAIKALGSNQIEQVPYNGGWAMIAVKGTGVLFEQTSGPFQPAIAQGQVPKALPLDPDNGRRPAPQPLVITGTAGPDFVHLSVNGDHLMVSVNGNQFPPYDWTQISNLTINTLGGGDTLSIDSALPFSPVFNAGGGQSTLNLNAGSLSVTADSSQASLNLNVSVAAAATLIFSAPQHLGGLNINGGNVLFSSIPQGVLDLGALVVTGNGMLDLSTNSLILHYQGNSPIGVISALVQSGYNGGAWNGPGISSSAAAANPSTDLGYGDGSDGIVTGLASDTVLVKYTESGDANLDGKVDFTDLVVLARHYGQANRNWDQGDFTYDGKVDFPDLVLLARNYGGSLASGSMTSAGSSAVTDLTSGRSAVPQILADVPTSEHRWRSSRHHSRFTWSF